MRYCDREPVAERMAAMSEASVILRETGLRRIVIDFNDTRAGNGPLQDIHAFATWLATNALLGQRSRRTASLSCWRRCRRLAAMRSAGPSTVPAAVDWLMGWRTASRC